MKLISKKTAMTYAEMILTLAIIGSIAAITMPGLKKYSHKADMGRLAQKANLTIENCVDNAILTKGAIGQWDFSSADKFFSEYIVQNIKHKSVSGNSLISFDKMKFEVTKCDGAVCTIKVDVNGGERGEGAPNKDGKDIFYFNINKDNETVEPTGMAACLRSKRWEFSDTMWKEGTCN